MNSETDPRLEVARKNLRIAIALRGTNASEVARNAGLSRNAVSQFISGKTSLSYANALRVCDILQIPIGALHRPDAITEARVRLHTILERMPDHLAAAALAEAQRISG